MSRALIVALVSTASLAEEPSVPSSPASIVIGLVRYEGHADWPGYLFERSAKTKELFAITQVFPQVTRAGSKVAPVTFVSMTHDAEGEALTIVDSTKRSHRVSIRSKERGTQWPVLVELVKAQPLTVRLTIPNLDDAPMDLDSPTVCSHGRPQNSVFSVEADGVEVPYRGEMKKRAPPDTYTVVKPGKSFTVEVDLSDVYTPPATAKLLRIRFSSFNHFSKNEVMFTSNVLEVAR